MLSVLPLRSLDGIALNALVVVIHVPDIVVVKDKEYSRAVEECFCMLIASQRIAVLTLVLAAVALQRVHSLAAQDAMKLVTALTRVRAAGTLALEEERAVEARFVLRLVLTRLVMRAVLVRGLIMSM